MTGRVNALEAINANLLNNGWRVEHVEDYPSRTGITFVFRKEALRLSIHFKLYGSGGSMRLTKFYGKGEPINWGVANAVLRRFTNVGLSEAKDFWQVERVFEGKNKRGQLIKFAKES